MVVEPTLKQTNSEKGKVITTKNHDNIVSTLPQAPPSDGLVSSAEKKREEMNITQSMKYNNPLPNF